MAALLALLSALVYGTSDFCAGIAGRRSSAGVVTGVAQVVGLLTAGVAVLLFAGSGPASGALAWGALSGVGSAIGTLALYRGLAGGSMSVVATLSAVLAAALPAIVGLALGEHLRVVAIAGLILAVPALALVSWHPGETAGGDRHLVSVGYGLAAGAGFALLFVALDRAGTGSGAWPLLPGQGVALVLVSPIALRALHRAPRPAPSTVGLMLVTGVLSGAANLLFLGATGYGALAVVAVLGAMYPAATVLLARVLLGERWTQTQAVGLLVAAVSIVLVSA